MYQQAQLASQESQPGSQAASEQAQSSANATASKKRYLGSLRGGNSDHRLLGSQVIGVQIRSPE